MVGQRQDKRRGAPQCQLASHANRSPSERIQRRQKKAPLNVRNTRASAHIKTESEPDKKTVTGAQNSFVILALCTCLDPVARPLFGNVPPFPKSCPSSLTQQRGGRKEKQGDTKQSQPVRARPVRNGANIAVRDVKNKKKVMQPLCFSHNRGLV